ncbi:unnamed protein product [Rotaria sp. Silwood2]|nr:unnamed protein product [Rotaria sp. Silwood2]
MIGSHLDNVRQARTHYINTKLLIKYEYVTISQYHLFFLLFCTEENVQLLDLPDELILTIMNKVKPHVLLLCSIITIGNNRLEQLALDKCHSIDLTCDYFQSPYESLMKRFYSHVMPRIINNIQSLTLNIGHVPGIISFADKYYNGTLPNLTHLKIMFDRRCPQTATTYASGILLSSIYFCKLCRNTTVL